jgi:hypothetical protein
MLELVAGAESGQLLGIGTNGPDLAGAGRGTRHECEDDRDEPAPPHGGPEARRLGLAEPLDAADEIRCSCQPGLLLQASEASDWLRVGGEGGIRSGWTNLFSITCSVLVMSERPNLPETRRVGTIQER